MTTITGDILAPKLQAQTATPAAVAAAQAPIAAIADRQGASNDRRQSGKNDRNLNFRAVLSTTTFGDLADATSSVASAQPFSQSPPRQSRVPQSAPEELSGTEATSLYNAAQASRNPVASAQFRTATTSYAKSFFSVEGTFAKPGQALELSI